MFLFEWYVTKYSTVFTPEEWGSEVLGWVVEEGERGMMRVAMALSKMVEGGGCQGQSVEVVVIRYKQVKRIVEDEGGW